MSSDEQDDINDCIFAQKKQRYIWKIASYGSYLNYYTQKWKLILENFGISVYFPISLMDIFTMISGRKMLYGGLLLLDINSRVL